ncbi:MAG: hypothetical protein JWM85_1967 [Acidimicrobiaceae bacterium]|nr:hypothetical protein [Acidimicrobiaceae bacterium]
MPDYHSPMAVPDLDTGRAVVLALAGLGAGMVNGIAGGGTLLTFPALIALGYPALAANVTSTVGIWPGYIGGLAGFRVELSGQRDRLVRLLPATVGGGTVGGVLLLTTPSSAFSSIAPYLILFAGVLFACQPLLAARLRRRSDPDVVKEGHSWLVHGGIFLASIYGGYFGAGLGVILLAVLGSSIIDRLVRINGLRAVLSLAVNTLAALIFVIRAPIAWSAAGLLAGTALIGGYVGARIARKVPAVWLRVLVICLGLATAGSLLAR